MRWTFSAMLTAWNQVENARTRSRASAGGRSRIDAASSARASCEPARPRIAATRSSSTSSNRCSPPCSRRIPPTMAPSACTSSRSGSCLGGKWMSLRFNSRVPDVGLRRKICALRGHYAKALAGGRLHHLPALDGGDAPRAEPRETQHLCLDVVGLDVEVHAAGVGDLLDLEVHLIRRRVESAVDGVQRLVGTYLEAERCAPEA